MSTDASHEAPTALSEDSRGGRRRSVRFVVLCAFLAIAGFFLWIEHRAHALGALPYLLVLACPLFHLFMHGGHGHDERGGHGHEVRR